jgi:hypothetical protein
MDEWYLEEPLSTSWPSSPDRYEFPFLQVIRASPGSRDGGLKSHQSPRREGSKKMVVRMLAWSRLHMAAADWHAPKAVT